MKFQDLTGQKFGHLTALYRDEDHITPSGQHKTYWVCQCDCEDQTIVSVDASHLKSGHTKSCGCARMENVIKTIKKYNRYDLSGEYGIGWTTNTNKEFYFDLEDYDLIKNYAWSEHYTKKGSSYIASTSKHILLHRLVMENPVGRVVDHKNHNTFDCRKQNLRNCTVSENSVNSERKFLKGVSKTKSGKFKAEIRYNNEKTNLGTFNTEDEAFAAREKAEVEIYKEYRYNPIVVEKHNTKL